jgi:hypothetical protein
MLLNHFLFYPTDLLRKGYLRGLLGHFLRSIFHKFRPFWSYFFLRYIETLKKLYWELLCFWSLLKLSVNSTLLCPCMCSTKLFSIKFGLKWPFADNPGRLSGNTRHGIPGFPMGSPFFMSLYITFFRCTG